MGSDDSKSKGKEIKSEAGTSSVQQGYPPGYGQQPPAGYHPSAYPYQYAQPPPAAYYYESGQADAGASCCGCLLSFMITVLLLMCLSSMITWLLLHPEMPRFHVDKFSVTDFVANESFLSGTWDADLRVENPNQKLRLHFERVQSGILYDGDFVSMTLINPFFINTHASTVMKVAMTTNNTVGRAEMQDMMRDRKAGAVTFTLRLETIMTFNSDLWTKQAYMRIVCEDLKVGFSGGSQSGTLVDKGPKGCMLYF